MSLLLVVPTRPIRLRVHGRARPRHVRRAKDHGRHHPVLITAGYQEAGTGPQFWVIASAGLAIGLGTYSGGWRIMRTMGKGIVDVKAPQGFAAETTSAAAILASSHMGFGLSTTQVCSGSIVGSGVGKKLAEVRWTTARKISAAGCSPSPPRPWSAAPPQRSPSPAPSA